jgi:hypothetical protein
MGLPSSSKIMKPIKKWYKLGEKMKIISRKKLQRHHISKKRKRKLNWATHQIKNTKVFLKINLT